MKTPGSIRTKAIAGSVSGCSQVNGQYRGSSIKAKSTSSSKPGSPSGKWSKDPSSTSTASSEPNRVVCTNAIVFSLLEVIEQAWLQGLCSGRKGRLIDVLLIREIRDCFREVCVFSF